jgi:5-methylcytosine-specific restriction endonuclease McrA
MQGCVILNGDYSYLNTIKWEKAMKMEGKKGKAHVLKYSSKIVRTAENVMKRVPAVMKLLYVIRTIYRTKVPFSKKNIIMRDNFTCQYCGTTKSLTIDHVTPSSKGGKTTFENCVTACMTCNGQKGDQLPSEAHMYLKRQPTSPTISEFTRLKAVKDGIFDLLKELGVY